MIKTTVKVSYNPINMDEKEFVYAEIIQAIRNDKSEIYTLTVQEWVVRTYKANVPDGNGGLIELDQTERLDVRTHTKVMSFDQADQLTAAVDQQFAPTETGSRLRKAYTILGHLLINNMENVRNVSWELVE